MNLLWSFFTGPWSSVWALGNTLDGITLLLTAGLGAAVAFWSGCFNMGGEGQVYIGGFAASVVLLWGDRYGFDFRLLGAAAGILTGACMSGISGVLKKSGAHEIITTFLISASLFPVADYAIAYLLRDPSGNLLASAPFIRTIPRILPPSHLSLSFPVALILIIGTFFFFRNTAAGYRFTIAGTDPEFARFGAIDPTRFWLPSLALSGAFHGLAGFFAVAGTYGRCHTGFSGGIGWSAVAVALIAGKYPLALIPAAFGYGALKSGSDSLLLSTGMSFESTAFIQAAVLFLATVQFKKVFRHVR